MSEGLLSSHNDPRRRVAHFHGIYTMMSLAYQEQVLNLGANKMELESGGLDLYFEEIRIMPSLHTTPFTHPPQSGLLSIIQVCGAVVSRLKPVI